GRPQLPDRAPPLPEHAATAPRPGARDRARALREPRPALHGDLARAVLRHRRAVPQPRRSLGARPVRLPDVQAAARRLVGREATHLARAGTPGAGRLTRSPRGRAASSRRSRRSPSARPGRRPGAGARRSRATTPPPRTRRPAPTAGPPTARSRARAARARARAG